MAVQQARYAASIYLTPAELASYPGPSTGTRYAYVKSLDATFAWVLGDTTTADNASIISVSGGSIGRWKRIGSSIAASLDTRATLQTQPLPANGRVIFIAEVGAAYKFDSSSSATADGWTSLTANDATPGRWILQGGVLSLSSSAQTTDATTATIASYSVRDNSLARVRATIVAKQLSTNVAAHYTIQAAFKRHSGGVATEVGVGSIDAFEDTAASAWDAAYDTDGANTIRIRFTGAAATTIDIRTKIDVYLTP